MYTRTQCTRCKQICLYYTVLTLSPLSRGTDKEMLTPLFFFPVQSRGTDPQLPSKEDTSCVGKGGGSKGDTPTSSRSLCTIEVRTSKRLIVTSCPPVSPPVDGGTSLRHHSRPHAGGLGTTRSSDLREMIYAPTAEHEWLVRRGPGIGSHTGRQVRDGHIKGPGPNRT